MEDGPWVLPLRGMRPWLSSSGRHFKLCTPQQKLKDSVHYQSKEEVGQQHLCDHHLELGEQTQPVSPAPFLPLCS